MTLAKIANVYEISSQFAQVSQTANFNLNISEMFLFVFKRC